MVNKDFDNGFHTSTIRPNGTLVGGNNNVINGTVVIYTVGVNLEVFLTQFYLNANTTAGGIVSLSIYNAVPAWLFYITQIDQFIDTSSAIFSSLTQPILLPVGYSIRLTSSAALVTARGGILGYSYPTA